MPTVSRRLGDYAKQGEEVFAMAHSTTVIDCREQCTKYESECMQRGKSAAKCRDDRRRCERTCIFK